MIPIEENSKRKPSGQSIQDRRMEPTRAIDKELHAIIGQHLMMQEKGDEQAQNGVGP